MTAYNHNNAITKFSHYNSTLTIDGTLSLDGAYMLRLLKYLWHFLTDPYVRTCPHCGLEDMCEECLYHWSIK
ncbi:hypothetical protein GBB76_17935 [Ancylobacter sp. TS-1]|nr:hypothetical protein GBB76_17935 [Ancylobacter sp. TS-1]